MPRPEAAPNYHQRLTVAEEISERLGAVVGYRIQGEIAGDLVFSKSPDHSEVAFDLAFAPEGGEQRFTCSLDIHGNVVNVKGLGAIAPRSADEVFDTCLHSLRGAPPEALHIVLDRELTARVFQAAQAVGTEGDAPVRFSLGVYNWGERPNPDQLSTIALILSGITVNPRTAEVALRDSGQGVSVEASPQHGVTLLTLNDVTVRVAASKTGTSLVVSASSQDIDAQFQLLRLRVSATQLGMAPNRIVPMTADFLEVKDLNPDIALTFDAHYEHDEECFSPEFGKELYATLAGRLGDLETFSNLTHGVSVPVVLVARGADDTSTIGMLLFNATSSAALLVTSDGVLTIVHNEGGVSEAELRAAAHFPRGEALPVDTRLGSGWAGLVDKGCFEGNADYLSREEQTPLVQRLRHGPDGEVMREVGRVKPHIPTAQQLDCVERLLAEPFCPAVDLQEQRSEGDIVVVVRGGLDPHSEGHATVFIRALQRLGNGLFRCLDIEGRNAVVQAQGQRGQMCSPRRGIFVGELMFTDLVPHNSYQAAFLL